MLWVDFVGDFKYKYVQFEHMIKRASISTTSFLATTLFLSSVFTVNVYGALPDIVFKGTNDTFTATSSDQSFLVKRSEPFRFDREAGDSYTAKGEERVWMVSDDHLVSLYKKSFTFGYVEPGCVIDYVQIDDNDDDRRNTWYIDGLAVHTMPQGWVVYGSFTAPNGGELVLEAKDSIAAQMEFSCIENPPVPTTTPIPEPTQEVIVKTTPIPTAAVLGEITTLPSTGNSANTVLYSMVAGFSLFFGALLKEALRKRS